MSHVRAPSRETAANRARVLRARELRHLFILFAAPVVWLVKAVVRWNERYTLRQRLQELPDHMLKDIGISRDQIDAVVSGSLKRGPTKLETAAAPVSIIGDRASPRKSVDTVALNAGRLDDGRAQFTPHGAFELPDTDETMPPRESIELRTLVIVE